MSPYDRKIKHTSIDREKKTEDESDAHDALGLVHEHYSAVVVVSGPEKAVKKILRFY